MAMDATITLCAGGAAQATTTSEAYLDLRALQGCTVAIFCDDQDVYFCGSATASGTLVTGTQAASMTALVADRVGKGTKVFRRIDNQPYLVHKTVTGTGTIKVKVVERPQAGF